MSTPARRVRTAAVSPTPATALDSRAPAVAAAAGMTFVALLLALHVLEPQFDPTWRFVSEYALGDVGWLMGLAFAALATGLLATVGALGRRVRTVAGRLGLGIVALAAAGLLLAAVFRTDPITTPADAYSPTGQLHVLGASVDFAPAGMLLVAWTRTGRALGPAVRVTAVLATGLMVGFVVALPADGVFGPGVVAGLVGRVLLLSYVAWIVAVARALRRGAGAARP